LTFYLLKISQKSFPLVATLPDLTAKIHTNLTLPRASRELRVLVQTPYSWTLQNEKRGRGREGVVLPPLGRLALSLFTCTYPSLLL